MEIKRSFDLSENRSGYKKERSLSNKSSGKKG
jgi:hypothetical protein